MIDTMNPSSTRYEECYLMGSFFNGVIKNDPEQITDRSLTKKIDSKITKINNLEERDQYDHKFTKAFLAGKEHDKRTTCEDPTINSKCPRFDMENDDGK